MKYSHSQVAGALLLLLFAQLVSAAAASDKRLDDDLAFVEIPEGCYLMGSTEGADALLDHRLNMLSYQQAPFVDETPQHEVCLQGFSLGKYEVIADQWLRIMGELPPNGEGPQPATGLSWGQVQDFAQRLSESSKGAYKYRLPTEAEWEYACRAGREENLLYSQLPQNAWFAAQRHNVWANSTPGQIESHAVGLLLPNAWGVYDMLGNAWELTEDSYVAEAYRRPMQHNPLVKSDSPLRVMRGGSYRSQRPQIRCANRASYFEDQSLPQIGFRLVREDA